MISSNISGDNSDVANGPHVTFSFKKTCKVEELSFVNDKKEDFLFNGQNPHISPLNCL